MLNKSTTLNMVIGYPLTHTKSPLLHNALYRMLNCNAVMVAKSALHLTSLIEELKKLSVGLVAVTMPFKQEILPYLDELSESVKATNAANTVINRYGKLFGYNTDVDGVEYALRDQMIAHKTALIIGAGGAARAAAYYFRNQEANLLWLNRTSSRSISLVKEFGGKIVQDKELNLLSIDIIINATPLGMFPAIAQTPIPDYQFQNNQVVFDMVYHPVDTDFLRRAKQRGSICISGIDMFIGQGLKQIEIWQNTTLQTSTIIESIKSMLLERK